MLDNHKRFLLFPAFILLMLTILLQHNIMDVDRKYCLYDESTFFSSLTAGVKKFIAHECWNEADIYLHQGLMHDDKKHDAEDKIHELDNHEHHGKYGFCTKEHHASKPNPLLPYNRSDFVHTRHAKPLDDKELLPWFKMSAFMNPHLTRAYVCGGYWLAWRLQKPKDAIEFLEEGIINNPGSSDILAELGMIYFDADNRLGTRNLQRAIAFFNKAIESEQSGLRLIQLLAYRSESYALSGEPRNAVYDLDKKIALMVENGWENTDRLNIAMRRRDQIAEMISAE